MLQSGNTRQIPPWVLRLAIPFIARDAARNMRDKHPHLDADEILQLMRQQADASNPHTEKILAEVARYLPDLGAGAATPSQSRALHWYSPSSLALIIANLVPLYGVLVLGWSVFPILLLFWLENVVIGVLNALRMLLVDPGNGMSWAPKLFLVPFFCFHYGAFTAAHGMFVVGMFGNEAYTSMDHGLFPIHGAISAIVDYGLLWAVIGLAASHLFSLVWNFLGKGEFRRASLMELMQRPYGRIVVLHITIILGGAGSMALGSPLWSLLLLLALKIGFDLRAHLKEHRKALG